MNPRWILAFTALSAASLLASAQAPATQTHTSNMGFSYALPSDWQVMQAPSTLADVKQQQSAAASSETEKKGIQCVQIALTARHGASGSMIVVVQLPEACFGQTITNKDLPGFAQGALTNIKQTMVLSDPVYGAYTLGTHDLQIERVAAVVIGHPEAKYTVEITCGVLKKGAVCWMAMAADNADLATFEQGQVSLDGEPPAALVPADAFEKSSSSAPPGN
jgi:hypothetical protein